MYRLVLDKMSKPVYNIPEQRGIRNKNVPIQISVGNL